MKNLLELGLFEPDKLLYPVLLGRMQEVGNVNLRSMSKDKSIQLIKDSDLPDLHGALVGNFGGSAQDMKEVILELRSKYPNAFLVGMVDSPKFKVGANYTTLYENLYSNIDWIVAQILVNANRTTL